MKQIIQSGKPAYGVSVQFPSPEIVEMIGELNFDWVMLDAEHGSITADNIGPMIMAAEIRGLTPIVRPENNDPSVINKYLDRGAMGVQVPHINTADEARAVVDACLYHPQGMRGLGGGRMADFGWGSPVSEYVKTANSEMLVCVQIEDVIAVENLDEILDVENIDVFRRTDRSCTINGASRKQWASRCCASHRACIQTYTCFRPCVGYARLS